VKRAGPRLSNPKDAFRNLRNYLALGVAIPLCLPIIACGGGDKVTGPAVATVSVTLAKSEILIGETTTGTATLKDATGAVITGRAVTWSSGTTSVATVSSTGVVTGVTAGTSVIAATSEGNTGTATVTVTAPVASVTVSLASSSISIGSTTQATATLQDAGGNTLTGRTVAWSSGTTSVATVDANGLVTGVGTGTSVITATSEGKSGTATVMVTANPPGGFTLGQPANRSAGASTTPQFSWQSSSGATSYTIEVATSSSFGSSDVINQSGITTTGFTPTSALQAGTVYFWRVTAVNSGGATVATNAPFEFSAPIAVGNSPGEVAVTPDGARALVVNSANPGTVTIVSLSTKAVTGSIMVGAYPRGIAIRPDGAEAVVTNTNSLSALNLTTNAVSQTIAMPCVSTTLYDIAYTPDGTKVVFPDLSSGCTQEGLRTVTVATAATTFVNLSTSAVPLGVAVMSNGNSALVTLGITGTSIKRVNLSTSAVTTISNTSSSFGVAVLPDNTAAVVASGQGDTIKRIDLAANTSSSIVAFDSNQYWHNVAITPDGTKAVVVGDFTSAVISLSTNAIIATFPNGGAGVAVTPDGNYALITALSSGSSSSGILRVIRIP